MNVNSIPEPPVDIDPSPPPPPAELIPPPPPADEPPPPPEEDTETGLNIVPQKSKKGWASKSKSQPLSVEELVRAKREADAAAAKPRFLSKAQREKLAIEKRQKEVEDARSQKATSSQRPANGFDGHADRMDVDTRQVNRPHIPSGPKSQLRNGGPPNGPSAMRRGRDISSPPPAAPKAAADSRGQKRAADSAANDAETQAVLKRQRYMGADVNVSKFSAQKKRNRTTDKKFNFEWNADEDTTPDYDPLYRQRADVNLGYGRGRLAGFDDAEAEKSAQKYAAAVAERDKSTGSTRAAEILELERRRREDGSTSRSGLEKHWSDKPLAQMRERDWRIFKEDFNIATKGGSLPNPMRNWPESNLPQNILDLVTQVGYTDPTPIQRAAIPIALQSRDLIGVAVTGSGKTASFLLPLLVYISSLPSLSDPLNAHLVNDGPYALILAPTRELAQQIESEAKKFAKPMNYTVVSIVGGHDINEQIYALRDGAEIIIATPGRLVDMLERKYLVLSQCVYVVMDEADRMIDMGFEEPVNKILSALPASNLKPDTDEAEDPAFLLQNQRNTSHMQIDPYSSSTINSRPTSTPRYRQTMMYSATMPPALSRIAQSYLRRPATITIGSAGQAVDTVEQRVEFIGSEHARKKRLAEILYSQQFKPPIIVFVNIKRNCDAIARDIKHLSLGLSVATLHGSKTQDQREAALASLRNGTTDVLVATDLAGRGIDVPDVSLVVNFNMAGSIESYTHRIGRTGRAGKSGVAITFLGSEDNDVLFELKNMLGKSEISRVPEELRRHEAAQQKSQRGTGGVKKSDDNGAGGGGSGGWGGGKSAGGGGGGWKQ